MAPAVLMSTTSEVPASGTTATANATAQINKLKSSQPSVHSTPNQNQNLTNLLSTRPMTTAPPPKRVDSPPLRKEFSLDAIEEALDAFKRGEFLVVMDDESRENEGDLIVGAHHCTTEKMAWMIRYTSGFICVSLPGERVAELELPMMMGEENQDRHRTAYTVSADYKHGTTTGISAHDRSLTAFALSSPDTLPTDFTRPGHIMPLRARQGGVLTRRGHTEAAVDLCRLTGLPQAGVLCELVNEFEEDKEGGMMRRDGCRAFADRWGLKMVSVEQLAEFRIRGGV